MKLPYLFSSTVFAGLVALGMGPASAQTVDVQQYWTSSSEAKAMRVIADAFAAHGGKWIDSPSANFDDALAAATSRIAGGEPPSAILMTPNAAMRDLAAAGQLRNLDELAAAGQWSKVLPPMIIDKLTVDGHVVAAPVGIHAENWIWYSKPLFDELGIQEPKNVDELFAAADKLKAAGYIAFAVGGEPWQEIYILNGLILSLGGPEYWNKLIVERDPEALKSPILTQAFDLYRKASTYADPASPGRSWSETTNLIMNNKAGMQFMGDWARGDFLAAGKVAGKDFGCFLTPGSKPAYAALVDVFTFPVNTEEDRVKGQDLLVETVMAPETEEKLAEVKGSVPARNDVDSSKLDVCAGIGLKTLSMPGAAVIPSYDALPGDLNGRYTDLSTQFWTTPSMTTEDAIEAFAEILASQ